MVIQIRAFLCVWLIPHRVSLGGRQIPPPSGAKTPLCPSSHPPDHVSSGAPVTKTPQSVPQTWDFILGSVLKCTGRWEISPEQSPEEAVLEVPQRDRKSLGSRGRSAILRARAGWRELLLVIFQEPITQGWVCSLSSNSVPYLNFSLSHFLLRVSQR